MTGVIILSKCVAKYIYTIDLLIILSLQVINEVLGTN